MFLLFFPPSLRGNIRHRPPDKIRTRIMPIMEHFNGTHFKTYSVVGVRLEVCRCGILEDGNAKRRGRATKE